MRRALPGILAGGVAGSVLRWAIGELGWSATATLLIVNTLGCAILGGLVAAWPDSTHRVRLTYGLGLCGGLTTFSGLAVRLAQHLDAGAPGDAAGLLASSLVLGALAFLGARTTVAR